MLVIQRNDILLAEFARFDTSSLETKIWALVLLGLVAALLFRQRFTRALESVLIWVVIALVLALGYTYRFELRDVADRVLAEFIPGRAATRGNTVEIARGGGGGFSVSTQVNGARIAMVLDTGASAVVLTQEAAKAAGLPLEVLNYSVNVETANGRARAAPVTLDRVSIGGITERASAGADRATGAAAHQPARHELPQPAGELGSARRQADDAGLSVTIGRVGRMGGARPQGRSRPSSRAMRAIPIIPPRAQAVRWVSP